MLLPIFEPKNCSEETTGLNWMKLGMVNLYGNTNNIIEAIFDFSPLSRDMGPLRGTPRGPRGPKIFFSIFRFFLHSMMNWCLNHMKITKQALFWPGLSVSRRVQMHLYLIRHRSTLHFCSVSVSAFNRDSATQLVCSHRSLVRSHHSFLYSLRYSSACSLIHLLARSLARPLPP